ncbi:MAG: class II fructose-bisphosphate aldolase [Anaerolineaceae bacterium]|nr:class II fructose-bisphosphate aldolase [Anaerolineaceae bacterium]
MLVPVTQFYPRAYGCFAIGAFSVNTIEQVAGAFRGAQIARCPLIVQVSGKARSYVGPNVLEASIRATASLYPEVVYALHLDHGDEASCYACIDSGYYSSVMIDASKHTFEENVAITRRVVQAARRHGISVEAELGRLSGKEDDISVDEKEAFFTNPAEAADFVSQSGCDALAVAVGTSHGINKFKGEQSLGLERLAQIQARLTGFPLVLHGASSVPAEEIRRINAAGGQVDPQSRGVPEAQYLQAARLGICKINVDTDSRLIWTRVQREYLQNHPQSVDFREPGRIFMDEMAQMIIHHSRLFGCFDQIKTYSELSQGEKHA